MKMSVGVISAQNQYSILLNDGKALININKYIVKNPYTSV